jgi:hypothetical protein
MLKVQRPVAGCPDSDEALVFDGGYADARYSPIDDQQLASITVALAEYSSDRRNGQARRTAIGSWLANSEVQCVVGERQRCPGEVAAWLADIGQLTDRDLSDRAWWELF